MPITATVTRGFTFDTGVELDSASLNQLGEPTVTINEGDVNITGGEISGLDKSNCNCRWRHRANNCNQRL